jgi:hypothetical protein
MVEMVEMVLQLPSLAHQLPMLAGAVGHHIITLQLAQVEQAAVGRVRATIASLERREL